MSVSDAVNKTLYNALLPVAVGAGCVASLFHPKLRESVDGRRGLRRRWDKAASSLGGKPVWFHVASVGEYEQAKPVISLLRLRRPETPVVVTFSSPSGYRFAVRKETLDESNNIKFLDYLPFDFLYNVRFCLDRLDPRLVVFVKFDLWPNLIWETRRRGVPCVLIDATLSPSSRRASGSGRGFYRSVYAAIDKILAISQSDAERFLRAVPEHPALSVTGDTRFDRVMERKRLAAGVGFEIPRQNRRVVIGGSTWPRDEAHLLPALERVMREREDVIAVLAPHEPHPERVEALVAWAAGAGMNSGVTSAGVGDDPPRVLVVDTVGVLAETYRYADVAYIGGSFSTGVHSVIEPAIEGLPVLFGPRHHNSFEALRLIEAGAGFPVEGIGDIERTLARLLDDQDYRAEAGERAASYVESQIGAAEKCLAAIEEYL